MAALDHLKILARLPAGGRVGYLRDRAAGRLERWMGPAPAGGPRARGPTGWPTPAPGEPAFGIAAEINRRAWRAYQPRLIPGRLVVFRAAEQPEWPGCRFDDPTMGGARWPAAGSRSTTSPGTT